MPRKLWLLAYLGAATGLSLWAASYSIDFSVYYIAARNVLWEGGAAYGAASGLPWPMWYRYPPFFLFLVAPFAALGFPAAAFLWAMLKFSVLALLVRSLARRVPLRSWPGGLLVAAIAGPYLVNEIRYGNAQFFVFALTAAALLVAGRRPWLAAGALGTAVAIKIWPLFFVPYLAAQRRSKEAAASVAMALILNLAPALWFGWTAHAQMLENWYVQEYRIAAQGGSIWFPSQSLLGVMTRHLSDVDYRSMPDPNYPEIHWSELDPEDIRAAWTVIAIGGYAALLVAARGGALGEYRLHGVAFCALVLLQPYAQKQTALVVLLWPAIVAGSAWPRFSTSARPLALAAAALAMLSPLTLSASWQRVYLVWGVDALAVALLGISLAWPARSIKA